MPNNLKEFYCRLEKLSSSVKLYCSDCERHCCRGFIYLLDEEAETLLRNDTSVLEYHNKRNENGYMLDTYPRDENGEFVPKAFAPVCPNRYASSGRCSVYSNRPLVCRLYPIDIQEIKNKSDIYWVVHKKCDFVTKAPKKDVEKWLREAKKLVEDVDSRLLKEIELEWRKFACIMVYPPDFEGYNLYLLGKAFPQKS